MNLEELQIKISIELKDLEKQLKDITRNIDKTLGPKTTKKLMQDNHRVIKAESIAINKTLNKAFDVDYKKFNANLNAAMNQAKLTVRSACNDIRRELNSALNVKANIRVIGKTSIDGSATGKSSGSNVASNMASSQYIGAMIIKSTNEVIKVNNANTAKLEQAINGLTSKLTSALNKIQVKAEIDASKIKVNVPDVNVNVHEKEIKVSNDNSDIVSAITRLGNFNAQGFRGISKSIGQATSKIISAIKSNGSTNNGKIEIEDLKSSYMRKVYPKQLGTGSYGNNLPQVGHTNFSLGGSSPIDTTQIEAMKKAFELMKKLRKEVQSLALEASKVNFVILGMTYPLDGLEDKLLSVIDLMKKIHSLRKGITTDIAQEGPVIIDISDFKTAEKISKAVENIVKSFKLIAIETGKVNFQLGETSELMTAEVDRMRELHKAIKLLSTSGINFDLVGDSREQLVDVIELMKKIHALKKGIPFDTTSFKMGDKSSEYHTGSVKNPSKAKEDTKAISTKEIIIAATFKVIDDELLDIVNETIKKIKQSFESVAIETGKVNFKLGETSKQIINIAKLMKQIHKLRRGIPFDTASFEMGDSPSESHTGRVISPKESESTKAITQKEVIIPATFKVIDDELLDIVNETIKKIKQSFEAVSIETGKVNFQLGESGKLMTAEVDRMRELHKSVKALTTSGINFELLGNAREQLVDVIRLMKQIHALRRSIVADIAGFKMGDSTSESHTGKVVNPKRHEFTKAIEEKEVIEVPFKVIDDDLKEQVDKAVSRIKQVSLPTDVFKFDTDEITAKIKKLGEILEELKEKKGFHNEPFHSPINASSDDVYTGATKGNKAQETSKTQKSTDDIMAKVKEINEILKQASKNENIRRPINASPGGTFAGAIKTDKAQELKVEEFNKQVKAMQDAWKKASTGIGKPLDPSLTKGLKQIKNPYAQEKPKTPKTIETKPFAGAIKTDKPQELTIEEFNNRIKAMQEAWREANDPEKLKKDLEAILDTVKIAEYVANPIREFLKDVGKFIAEEVINSPELKNLQKMDERMKNGVKDLKPYEEFKSKQQSDDIGTQQKIVEAQKQLKDKYDKIADDMSINLDDIMEAMKSVNFPEFELAYGSIDDLKNAVAEAIEVLTSGLEELNGTKMTIDTSDTEKKFKDLLDISETIKESLTSGDYVKDEIPKPDKKTQYPPKAPGQNKSKDTKAPKGKPPKPTIMGFGFGAYKNEIDMLVEYAKKAGSKIKEALFGKKGSASDELAISIDDESSKRINILDEIFDGLTSKMEEFANLDGLFKNALEEAAKTSNKTRNERLNSAFDIDTEEYLRTQRALEDLKKLADEIVNKEINKKLNEAFDLDIDDFIKETLAFEQVIQSAREARQKAEEEMKQLERNWDINIDFTIDVDKFREIVREYAEWLENRDKNLNIGFDIDTDKIIEAHKDLEMFEDNIKAIEGMIESLEEDFKNLDPADKLSKTGLGALTWAPIAGLKDAEESIKEIKELSNSFSLDLIDSTSFEKMQNHINANLESVKELQKRISSLGKNTPDELAMTIEDSFNDEIVDAISEVVTVLKSIESIVENIFGKSRTRVNDDKAIIDAKLEPFMLDSKEQNLAKRRVKQMRDNPDSPLHNAGLKEVEQELKVQEITLGTKLKERIEEGLKEGLKESDITKEFENDIFKKFEMQDKASSMYRDFRTKGLLEKDTNVDDFMGLAELDEQATKVKSSLNKIIQAFEEGKLDVREALSDLKNDFFYNKNLKDKYSEMSTSGSFGKDSLIKDLAASEVNNLSAIVNNLTKALKEFELDDDVDKIKKAFETSKQMLDEPRKQIENKYSGRKGTSLDGTESSTVLVNNLREQEKYLKGTHRVEGFGQAYAETNNFERIINAINEVVTALDLIHSAVRDIQDMINTATGGSIGDEFAITVDDGDDDENPFAEFRSKLERASEGLIKFIEENAEEIEEQLEEVEEVINDNVPEIEPDFTLEGLFEFINDNMDAIIEAYENKLEEMQEVIDDADDFSEGVAQFIKDNLDKIIDAYEEKLNEIEEIVDDSADIIEESMENISDINLPILRSDALNEQFDAIRESIIKLDDSLDDIDDDREINIGTEDIDESISAISKIKKALSVAFDPINGPDKLDAALTRIERKIISVFNRIKKVLSKVFSPIINAAKKIITPIARVFKNIVASARNMAYKIRDSIKLALYKATALVKNYGAVIKTHLNKAFTGIKSSKLYTSIVSGLNKAKSAVSKFSGKVKPILNKAFSGIKVGAKIASGIGKGLNGAKKVLSKFASGCKSLWGKIKQIFSKGSSDASKATGKLKTGLKDLLKQALGFFSLYSLINLGKQAIQQSQMLAQSEVKLASLMKQRMGATNETVLAIRQLAEEQAKLGVVSETAMKNGAQQLARYVHSAKALKELMPAIANLTAARGGVMATPEDAEEIATQLGEAIREGTTTPLEQSGIYLSEAEIEKFKALTTEEERAAYLANVVAQNVGNINQALANTPHGSIAQLKNNFQSLLGTLGIFLANVIQPIVQWLNVIVVACNNALKALGKLLGFDMTGGALSVPDAGTGTAPDTTIDTGGVDNVKDSYDDAKKAADEATEANEKFKGSLMGFDELNILSDNTNKKEDDPTDITPGEGGQLTPKPESLPGVGELTEGENIFSKFSDKMKAFIDEVLTPFRAAWDLLGDRWKAEWADLVESFKHFCDSLATFLKSVWENGGQEFVRHLAEIGLACGIAAMEIGGEILDSLARLWEHLDPATNMNTQGFLDALNEVSVKLRDFILGLGDHFESLMANGGQDVLNALGDCFMNLGEAAVRGLGVVIDALDGLIDHLDPATNEITRSMLKAWENAFKAIGDAALSTMDFIESVMDNGGQDILNSLGDLGMKLGEAVGVLVEEVAKAWSELMDHMDPSTNPRTKNMLKSLDGLVDSVTKFVDSVIKAFKKFMDSGGRDFIKNLGDILAIVVDLAATLAGGIIDLVTAFIDSWAGQAIIEGVAKALEWVSEQLVKLEDAIEVVKDIFQDVIDIIVGILEGDGEKVGRAFANLIKNAFKLTGELLEWLWGIGEDLVKGIIEGLKKAPELLWNTIVFVFDTIVGFFKELFGIHSPSTVMADLGVNLLEGLAQGISDTISAVLDVLTELKDKALEKIKEMVDKAKEKYEELKNNISEKLQKIKEDASEKWTEIKDHTVEKCKEIYDKSKEKYEEIRTTVSDKLQKIKEDSSEKWSNIKEDASEKITKLKEDAETKYNKMKETLTTTMENWRKNSEEKWSKVKEKTQEITENLKTTVEEKYSKFKENLTTTMENWRTTSEEKWNAVKEKTGSLVEDIRTSAEKTYSTLKTNLGNKIQEIKADAETKWNEVKEKTKTKVSEVVKEATDKYGELKTNFTKKMDEVKTALGPKWEALKTNARTSAEDMVNKAKEGLKNLPTTMADKMEDALESMKKKIKNVGNIFSSIGDAWKLPKIKVEGEWSLNPLKVPSFKLQWNKRGGIIDGMTPLGFANGALQMGGEAGKELIMPLENTSFTSKIAQAIGQAVDNTLARQTNPYNNNNNNTNDNRDIVLKVNEREFARASINSINKLQAESGRTLLNI